MIQVWRKPSDIPAHLQGSAVTIGIFDGVHQGHQAVLAQTVAVAHAQGLLPLALTFDPHPQSVHCPESAFQLVSSLDDRIRHLDDAGIEAVYVQHYSLDYASMQPEDFVAQQLVQQLKARAVIVGEDVRFGAGNRGDAELLRALGEEHGYSVTLIPDMRSEEGRRWSSTWVRELLDAGDVAGAANVLGRAHRVCGIVRRGFQRGRMLGFPTANLAGSDIGEVPADGVYAGWVIREIADRDVSSETCRVERLPAAISVGTNPQFEAEERTVEAHVLGRADLDLYGQQIIVEFTERLRSMMTFGSVEELVEQIENDVHCAASVLRVPDAGRVDPCAVIAQ